MIERTKYDNEGAISSKTIYTYNEKNKLVGERTVDENGYQQSRWEYGYRDTLVPNPKGKYAIAREYDRADNLEYERTYSYNLKGDISQEVIENYESAPTTITYEYSYNDDNNWTRRVQKVNGIATWVTERQYNVKIPRPVARAQKILSKPTVSATSTAPGYPIENISDGNPATAWVQGRESAGATLTFEFSEPRDITNMTITPGYNKSEKIWKHNRRIKSFYLQASDASMNRLVELPDNVKSQTIPMNLTAVTWVSIKIVDTYPGEGSEDVCISEVSFQ